MPLTQQQVVEQEAAFLDSQFGQVDYSCCISLLKPPPEEDQLPDPRFAPLDDRGRGLGSGALRRGIEELANDLEVQERIASETGDPEIIGRIQDAKADSVTREFQRNNPTFLRTPENWDLIVQTLAYNAFGWNEDEATASEARRELMRAGFWTVENLTSVYEALDRSGELEAKPGLPRQLTEHQKRMVAMEATTGNVELAICRYLQFRLPEEIADEVIDLFSTEEVMDRLADPELKEIVAEAVYFCWEHSRCEYCPTAERRNALRMYVGNRIPTVRLLDAAWAAVQRTETDAARTSLLGRIREPDAEGIRRPDLESLSDDELESLYYQTRRKMAVDRGRRLTIEQ